MARESPAEFSRRGLCFRHHVSLLQASIFSETDASALVHFDLRHSCGCLARRKRFHFHMLAALAQFERGLIRERVKAGLEALGQRGAKAAA
jgi:hypothetical protein